MSSVELIITTYNNPVALHYALLGILLQSRSDFVICVADDGSTEATAELIAAWQQRFAVGRLRHVWHPDTGFKKNEILNKAITSSQADYLLFIDGDCIASPQFIARHLQLRSPGRFVSGGLIRMPLTVNTLLRDELVISGEIFTLKWLSDNGCIGRLGNYLKVASLPPRFNDLIERLSPVKRVWNGCNSSGWRQDLLKVNGFNESMRYGSEDVELGVRLNNAGIRGRHIRYSAPLLHIEHNRAYADPKIIASNKRYMKSVRRSGCSWTADGIQKTQYPGTPATDEASR
jgi:glycosyltransferase involved in cell wall biosynthesis